MTIPSPRGKEGIYRDIFFVSESIFVWTRRFGIVTFRLDFSGFAILRGRWYSGHYI
jgi:hypothetical protein